MLWSRLALVAALVQLTSTPVAAASFGEFMSWCTGANARPILCSGYLVTYLEGLASPDQSVNSGLRACVPENADRDELMRLIRAYAEANPSSSALPGFAGVGQALKDRYPCK